VTGEPPLCPTCGQPASEALGGPEHDWECRNEACSEFGQAVQGDEDLATRVRAWLADEPAVSERSMFGSLAFMVGGNLAVAVRGDELMVRTGEDASDEPGVRPAIMGQRRMKGWVVVDRGHVSDEWIGRGVAFARSLPPK